MSARSFFDTNVLVYAEDKAAPAKQKRAVDIVAESQACQDGSCVPGGDGVRILNPFR
jgi:predicted nucleic acid-binding protein